VIARYIATQVERRANDWTSSLRHAARISPENLMHSSTNPAGDATSVSAFPRHSPFFDDRTDWRQFHQAHHDPIERDRSGELIAPSALVNDRGKPCGAWTPARFRASFLLLPLVAHGAEFLTGRSRGFTGLFASGIEVGLRRVAW
jgi:hypothetical protein